MSADIVRRGRAVVVIAFVVAIVLSALYAWYLAGSNNNGQAELPPATMEAPGSGGPQTERP